MIKRSKILFIVFFVFLLFGCNIKNENTTTKENTITENTTTKNNDNTTDNKEKEIYTVSFVDYNNTLLYACSVKEGDTPSYPLANPTRVNDESYSYTFKGWSPEITVASKNTTYVAQYDRNILKYNISFDLNGGESTTPITPIEVSSLDEKCFSFDIEKEDYAFKGWSYNDEIIFNSEGKQIKDVTMAENMTFKAEFSDIVTLNIYYTLCLPDTKEIVDTYYTKNSEFGDISETNDYDLDEQIKLSANLNEGYEMVGWYYNGEALSNLENYTLKAWNKDFTIEARLTYKTYNLRVVNDRFKQGKVGVDDGEKDFIVNAGIYYKKDVVVTAYAISTWGFEGWYDKDGNLVSKNATYKFRMKNSDYRLEAVWSEPDEFKIFDYDHDGEGFIIKGIKDKTLTEYVIPDSTKYMDDGIFNGCSNMVSLTIPFILSRSGLADDLLPLGYLFGNTNYSGAVEISQDGVKYYFPSTLRNVTITDTVVIPSYAFASCSFLTSINLDCDIRVIYRNAFSGCSGLTSLRIPNSAIINSINTFAGCTCDLIFGDNPNVTTIKNMEFCNYMGTSIVIRKSITSIEQYAFSGCTNLEKVYYEVSEYDKIYNIDIKADGNSCLTGATSYYYSETKPIFTGNYWHYDEDHNIVEW